MARNTTHDRMPMMLSAFVYPGAGQFMQKRWLPGGLFAILFSLFFLLLIASVITPLFAFLNDTLDWAAASGMGGGSKPVGIFLMKVALYFLASMVVYLANVADVIRATRRIAKPPPLPPILGAGKK
jgi:hypothetical protein